MLGRDYFLIMLIFETRLFKSSNEAQNLSIFLWKTREK